MKGTLSAAVAVLALAGSACEIRIGSGRSGTVTSISYVQEDGRESISTTGSGISLWINGKIRSLSEGGRLHLRRSSEDEEEREVVVVRRGSQYEAAARHGEKVVAPTEEDVDWILEKLSVERDEIAASPEIEAEPSRVERIRSALRGPFSSEGIRPEMGKLLFPSLLVPSLLELCKKESLSPEGEVEIFRLVAEEKHPFAPKDRDAVIEAIVSREKLGGPAILAIAESPDAVSYPKRASLASKLVRKPAFDRRAASSLLEQIDEVPYDGRTRVLSALYERQDVLPADEWLEAVFEEAPYQDRVSLIQEALAAPSHDVSLARKALKRLDDLPYDRRTAVLLQILKAPWTSEDAGLLLETALEDLPYQDRARTAHRIAEHPTLGAAALRKLLQRVDDLPYNDRGEFLAQLAKREDLAAEDQVHLVRTTISDAPYNVRGRILKALLLNPRCSEEARAAVKRHRKDLPSNQRDEIEEILMK